MKDGDYPRWTEYSHGNPDCWRRIYNGVLLYVIPDRAGFSPDGKWTWHDANLKPFKVNSGFATRRGAMKAAEEYAKGF